MYNYENLLIQLFGSQFALNEALVYSLQFSHFRTPQQEKASRSALSKDLADVVGYVEKYRNGLDDAVYNSQEYSIKQTGRKILLIQLQSIAYMMKHTTIMFIKIRRRNFWCIFCKQPDLRQRIYAEKIGMARRLILNNMEYNNTGELDALQPHPLAPELVRSSGPCPRSGGRSLKPYMWQA